MWRIREYREVLKSNEEKEIEKLKMKEKVKGKMMKSKVAIKVDGLEVLHNKNNQKKELKDHLEMMDFREEKWDKSLYKLKK